MKTFRIGVLGCGRVSQRHLEVYRDELRGAHVVAVCDKVESKAAHVARELKCKVAPSYEALLADKDIDLIVILTESGNHAQHTRAALEAGKHVIVEKPAALLPEEIDSLAALAKQKQLLYSVIFQNRFNPSMRALKSAWDAGRFGKLVVATVRVRWCRYQDYYNDGWHGTWAMDGGVINQQAIHHLDALQWICGTPESVVSLQDRRSNQLEAEDTTAALLKFSNGGLGVIEATTAARPRDIEASISIVGQGGSVVINGIALNLIDTWEFVEAWPEDSKAKEKYSQQVPTGYGLSHGPFLQETIDRLHAGVLVPPVSAQEGAQAVRLVHALYRSSEVGAWVAMNETPRSERLGRSVHTTNSKWSDNGKQVSGKGCN